MKRAILLCFIPLLTACGSVTERASERIENYIEWREDIENEVLDLGDVGYCKRPTVGALCRRYNCEVSQLVPRLKQCGWTVEQVDAGIQ